MKILSKRAVDAQVALQRKSAIDEGVRIASKVDRLRQDLASLEAQHARYISGMKDELHKETDGLISKVADLKSEISDLEEKRAKLLAPLNQEWENVKIKAKEILDREAKLVSVETSLSFREKTLLERDKKSKDSLFRIKTHERELERALNNALFEEDRAKSIRSEAESYKSLKEKEILDKELACEKREQKNRNDEEANKNLNDLLKAKERELVEREVRLNDREATLERNIKRLKNG